MVLVQCSNTQNPEPAGSRVRRHQHPMAQGEARARGRGRRTLPFLLVHLPLPCALDHYGFSPGTPLGGARGAALLQRSPDPSPSAVFNHKEYQGFTHVGLFGAGMGWVGLGVCPPPVLTDPEAPSPGGTMAEPSGRLRLPRVGFGPTRPLHTRGDPGAVKPDTCPCTRTHAYTTMLIHGADRGH